MRAALERREYGNQRLVQTEARARNVRKERYSIVDGTRLSPLHRIRRC